MYWSMLGKDVMPNPVPEAKRGEDIIKALVEANQTRSVKIRIAVSSDSKLNDNHDLEILKQHASIRQVNFPRLIGAGILHTKFIIVDGKHLYVGSANMDWRSLTHVKELGIVMKNNKDLAMDLSKIFEIYWFLGNDQSVIPNPWPSKFDTKFNQQKPLLVNLNDSYGKFDAFFTSSPKQLCSSNRMNDIDTILTIINEAKKYVYISVMDYFPMFLYERPTKFWPVIDDALRRAMIERKVQVRLLASHWDHTRPTMVLFLKSLMELNNQTLFKGSIDAKLFTFDECPFNNNTIPFSYVNHNKYMITDKTIYIGTSNWSADYFINTGGVAIVLNITDINQSKLHKMVKDTFLRDWNSQYAITI